MQKLTFVIMLLFSISIIPQQKSSKIFDNLIINKLASGFSFTEGPAADSKGNVYFTDQPNNKIYIWTLADTLKEFSSNAYRANGLYFNKNGYLIACTDEDNTLSSFSTDGKRNIIHKGYNGKDINAPNDLWIAPNGGIYFTDPYYQRPWWSRKESELDGEHVYYLPPNSDKIIKVIDDFVKPNGIIGTPDGKTVYVADIGAGKTYKYKINNDGTLTDKSLFCNEGSDGMTIDELGNVYLTNDAVSVFNSKGRKIAYIPIPERPANVTFGGKDRKTLFITARTSLYSLKLKVKGN